VRYLRRFISITLLTTLIISVYLVTVTAFFYQVESASILETLTVIVIMGVGTGGIMTWRKISWDKQMAMFIERLNRLKDNDNFDSGNILLPPRHGLHDLAVAVNDLQQWNRERVEVTQQNESALNTLWTNMPVGAIEIAPDRRILRVNLQALNMLNMAKNMVGQHYDDVITNHNLMMLLEQTLVKKVHSHEMLTINQNGGKKILDVTTEYYQTSAGQYVLLALFYDVTELVSLQERQNQFLANASHELRTPLTAIIGFTDTLIQGAAEDSDVRDEFLQIILAESTRLLELTQDILTLARVVDQEVSEQKEPVIVAELLQDVILSQHANILEKELHVENQIAEKLVLEIAPKALRQIMMNLVSNAIKYNRQAGKIVIRGQVENGQFTLTVQDSGIGISSGDQEHIFERFYRVDKARNHQVPGTGLGMAIVHDLVTQLNGTIRLESQLGIGTTVSVQLPG